MVNKLGKKPARHDPRDLRYADLRPKGISLPKFPKPGGGYGMDFGATGWGVLGNGPQDDGSIERSWAAKDGAGNCEIAGPCHDIMEGAKNAGRTVPRFTCLSALQDYAKFTESVTPGQGYDLVTGANDTGCDTQQVLSWRQKVGITDAHGGVHKIGPYFSVEPGNFEQMWEVLWLAECLGVGLSPFPQSASDQFDNGQAWVWVPGSPGEGGHWVIVVGHPTSSWWTGITWGERKPMSAPFITHVCDEVWAWTDPVRFAAVTGKDQQNFDAADVEKYLAITARQVAEAFG